MNQRIRIVPPINGISEDLGEADQPQGTTPKALNVRPLDPGSGRVQIAQRAGYTDLLASAMPGRVEAAATITYDDPKLIYQGPNASTIQPVWSAGISGDQNIVAVHVDRYGNLYALSDAGSFIKYGPDGKEVGRQTYYATGIEKPVRRIGTDYEGNVYVAVSALAGEASTLIKFEALEDDQFDIAWRWSGLWGIRDFAVFGGQIAVARFYALSDVDETENVAVLSQLYASEPTIAYETALPRPVSCLAFAESGEVLFASAANPYRNQPDDAAESWQAINVQWSPHEIEDVSGRGASWRLHWWIDAETLQDYVTGDRVKTVKDRRWLHTELPVEQSEFWMVPPDPTYSYYAPTDNAADRAGYPGWHKGDTSKQTFMMPVYRARGAGLKPSLRFNGPDKFYNPKALFENLGIWGSSWDWLHNPQKEWKLLNVTGSGLFFGQYYNNRGPKSSPNLAAPADDGPDKDGVMDRNRQPIPGSDNMSFAMFMVLRVEPGENREVIWHHKAKSGFEIALLHNFDSADLPTSIVTTFNNGFSLPSTPGKLTLFIGLGQTYIYLGEDTHIQQSPYRWQTHKGSHAAHAIASADMATEGALTTAWGATEAKYAGNDRGVAIVCIAINKEVDGSGNPYNSCEFRVNGRVIDTFHIDETLATGLRSELRKTESVFGMSTDRNFVTSFTNFFAWRGSLCEAITINGKTSNESLPNLDAVGYVSDGGNARDIDPTHARQWTDVSVRDYVVDPIEYTNAASEIERMEGYLAYKWGCQDVLPTSAGGTVTTGGGFQNVHPFAQHIPPGGSVVQDVYPVGRAAAGGVIAGATAAALQSEKEILGKVGSDGVVRWAIDGNGHGLGVVSGVDGYLCAVGRKEGESRVVAKKVRDLGNAVRVTGDNVWEYESDTQTDTQPVLGLAMDAQNNLYWPQYYKGDNTPDVVEVELTANLVGSPSNDILATGEIAGSAFGYVATSTAPPTSPAGGAEFMIGADSFETANNFAAAVNANGAVGVAHSATSPNQLFSASVYTNAAGNPVIQLRRKVFNKRLFVNVSDIAQWSFSSYPESAVYAVFPLPPSPPLSELLQLPFREWGLLAIGEEAETLYEYTPQNGKPACIAVDPQYPLMLLNPDKQGTAENLYVGLDAPGEGQDTVVKYQQLKRTFRITDNPGPRRTTHVAVANGGLYTTTRDSAPYYAPGGAARFNRTSPFVKLWVYRQKLYGLDGLNYVVYDPKKELVEEWKAEGKGKIPKGAKLACVYGDRIVLARTDEDPHNLHMSARGDANDWDTAPDILTPLSAFSGNSTGNLHFRANDLVNCLIPARDDLLYIGGDRSFTRLTGDPGGQGQIDNISQLEGIAFGDAYAVGPSGEVYVKGINTGIWRIDPSGSVNLLTEGWIERRMQNLDLSVYDVRMAWSFRQKGLHVYVVPKVTGPRVIESFWWDAKAGGWWMDEWSDETISPTCVTIWDGDEPGDRGVVIGCQDGMLRVEDEAAVNDGSKRIESEVILGPLTPADAEQVLFTALEPVLVGKPGYGGVWLEVYTAPIPDFQGGENPVFRHYVGPGYQGDLVISALANQIWVRLTNGAIGEKWALQTLFARVRVAGARRM